MRKNTVTIALSAAAVIALGFAAAAPALSAVEGQQKPAAKAAAPTSITVYKTPT